MGIHHVAQRAGSEWPWATGTMTTSRWCVLLGVLDGHGHGSGEAMAPLDARPQGCHAELHAYIDV